VGYSHLVRTDCCRRTPWDAGPLRTTLANPWRTGAKDPLILIDLVNPWVTDVDHRWTTLGHIWVPPWWVPLRLLYGAVHPAVHRRTTVPGMYIEVLVVRNHVGLRGRADTAVVDTTDRQPDRWSETPAVHRLPC